ncbi:sporulation initiation factor Spo0A C-terminal domain-containing protein [Hominifimenecus sp. rT4P-3]|uniref:sporulation initiation factor Spo0A C-terminal domain-containing protein n=1 Tax=Hominifimenecus sp. rT4P-3 TaxID=3242979 RepID=UPI003DA1E091
MYTKFVQAVIFRIAGRPTAIGYKQLARAVTFVLQSGATGDRNLTTVIYPQIAKDMDSTPQTVARNIARAVEDCWEHGDRKKLEEIVGHRLSEKPSPGELIHYICRYYIDTHENK